MFSRAITRLVSIFAAVASLASPLQAGGNLLINGSFEDGNYTYNGDNADSLQPGSTAITGWTTITAELAVINNNNVFYGGGLVTPFGDVFLDLTGYHDSAPYGGVEQAIATTAGQSYSVSLYLGVDNSAPAGTGPVSVTLDAGSATTSLTADPTGIGTIWTPLSWTFTADSSSTLITIQGTQGKTFIGLDDVSVQAVPEPSSLVLGLLATIIGGGLSRPGRKRAS